MDVVIIAKWYAASRDGIQMIQMIKTNQARTRFVSQNQFGKNSGDVLNMSIQLSI